MVSWGQALTCPEVTLNHRWQVGTCDRGHGHLHISGVVSASFLPCPALGARGVVWPRGRHLTLRGSIPGERPGPRTRWGLERRTGSRQWGSLGGLA